MKSLICVIRKICGIFILKQSFDLQILHCAPLRYAPFRMTFFRNKNKKKGLPFGSPSITSLKTLVIIFYQGVRYIRRILFLSFPLSG